MWQIQSHRGGVHLPEQLGTRHDNPAFGGKQFRTQSITFCVNLWLDPAQFSLCQFKSVQFSLGQFRLGQFRSVLFMSVQFSLGQFSLVQFRLGQFRLVQFRSIRFMSVQFSLGQCRPTWQARTRKSLCKLHPVFNKFSPVNIENSIWPSITVIRIIKGNDK